MKKFIVLILCYVSVSLISAQNITSAEYYFDANDNGFGSNTALTISQPNESYNISIAGLSDGFHDMYIRVFDQASNGGVGAWSHYDRTTFYISSFPTGQNIVAARYYIDNGSVTNLNVDPTAILINESYLISIGSLSEGFHNFYIQTQSDDGTWSHYDRSTFYVSAFPSDQDIVAARYFFNNDTPINLTIDTASPMISQSYSIATTGLGQGFHDFYIQTQAADGIWSLYDRQTIYINELDGMPSDVVAAEYYIDEDLGIGNNTPFSITMPTQMISFNTTGLSEGDHLFCIRVQNADSSWSLYDCDIFTIDANLGTEDSLYKSVKVQPNPFVNTINIEVSRSIVFNEISIYDITGKKVYTTTNDLRKINLDNLEAGTYILSLLTETKKATFKIIKQ